MTPDARVATPRNHTLFARWTANAFTVTYDNEGGAGCTTLSVSMGAAYGASGPLCTPTRAGYTFGGWYRGDGQKFRVRISVGSLTNSFEHSFEEPALWERDLAVGYSIERRFAGFASADYAVLTEGVNLYARRRVFGNVEGRVGYNPAS